MPIKAVHRVFRRSAIMSDELKAMLDRVRDYQMSQEEKRAQEIGFAFGNVHYENERVTRDMVARSLPPSDRRQSSESGLGW
jgi:hypothetical protein